MSQICAKLEIRQKQKKIKKIKVFNLIISFLHQRTPRKSKFL
jgi:hypothetical protein